MKISVVTVCFNAEKTIGATIASFLAQSHADKELLVIDGASRDDTLRIVKGFESPLIKLVSEPDRGLYDAMNKGLSQYQGDAVGFLNADDRFSGPESLSAIAQGLNNCDIVSGDLDFVNAGDVVVRRWRGRNFRNGDFKRGFMAAHPTFYVRRGVVDAVGQFDLAYRIAADYDFMLRAYELFGFKGRHIPEVLITMRSGGKSTAGVGAYIRSNREALQARRRWLGSGKVDLALIRKPTGKLHQFFGKRDARIGSSPASAS